MIRLLFSLLVFITRLWIPGERWVLAESTTEEPSDDELVKRAQNSDRHAFNRLVGRYQALMYNIAYRVLGDREKAADATQDAFLAAYRKLDQYTGGNFRAWMARIVKNQCYDLLRYEKRRPAASLDALLLAPNDPSPDIKERTPEQPDEATLRQEIASWLQEVILLLPVEQRITLVMSDIQGYSYEEIATATEVELGTVKSRLARARRKVRELLRTHSELLPDQYRL